MRVGVVCHEQAQTGGGSFTFQASLLAAIQSTPMAHRFVILGLGGGRHAPDATVPWINLAVQYAPAQAPNPPHPVERLRRVWASYRPESAVGRAVRKLVAGGIRVSRRMAGHLRPARPPVAAPSLLDRAVQDFALDVVWFITPFHQPVPVPFFITVWDLQHRRQPYFPEVSLSGWTWEERERFYQATLPRAARIITGTEVGKDEIVRFYGVQPEQVVVNPFPLPESLVRPTEIPDEPDAHALIDPGFLLYPAQFWPHKNHINLLLALRVLRERDGLTPTLVLVGADKGNLAHVQATTEALGLTDQVRMLGFVPDAALVALYRRAEALVFASFFGPDNLPPLEAFGLECPVIAAGVPGAEEQLGDAALLFDPARPEELADCIRQLLQDPPLRARLIAKGRERLIGRSPRDYVLRIGTVLDEFEPIRRCWGRGYRYS